MILSFSAHSENEYCRRQSVPLSHCDWTGQVPATQNCGILFILVLFISCVANRWWRNEASSRPETCSTNVVPLPNVDRSVGSAEARGMVGGGEGGK